jgi:hypothetical protein
MELHAENHKYPYGTVRPVDTKVRCTCGAEFVSHAEHWQHAADALRETMCVIMDTLNGRQVTRYL